jgi:hypothetical protein
MLKSARIFISHPEIIPCVETPVFTKLSSSKFGQLQDDSSALRGVSYRKWRSSAFGILTRFRTGQPRKYGSTAEV